MSDLTNILRSSGSSGIGSGVLGALVSRSGGVSGKFLCGGTNENTNKDTGVGT